MKYFTLIAATAAIKLSEPWNKASLPDCPADEKRTRMEDLKTHVAPYPYVGATCKKAAKSKGSDKGESAAVASAKAT
jgi:hypothetical protein